MTACPIRYQRQVPDRKGKIFYTSITSLSHISKVYPIENNCKEENLQGIYRTGRELLQNGLRLLPTDAGEYCSVSEALLPYAKNIAENITQPILRSEYGENACWIESEISSEANARLWGYLTHCFGIRVLRWKDVLPKLKAEILEEQTDEWLLHLMEVIYPTCTGNLKLKDKVDAHEIPFVRLQDGTHIYCRYDGVAQVYINNPISAKNKISTKILQVIYALSDFLIMILSWLVKQSLRAFLFQEVQP